MFWKSVNLKRIKSWSLVTKLMLLYSLSTIGILSSVGLFLYPTFAKIVYHTDNVYVSGDTTLSKNYTAKCYKEVITALLLGTLIAIILGYFIARNALSRIREFTDKMEIVTANSLHERINPSEWPKELKILAERYNNMLDRVQASFIQLVQFSSDIAHELRNPVHNLRGITEIALSKEKTVTEYRQILESNIDEYDYLTKLIENLLFLARSEHGQIKINKKAFNVREKILKMFEYFQAIADEKNIELLCEGDAIIYVEPTLFKRAINNLLSNALRYSFQNGKIRIQIKSVNKKIVKISISDNGIGIHEEHLTKVFDRFYRIDPSRSSQSGGLGLGLAIVKSIIELHQGKINIESKLNLGTTIHLLLSST